MRDKRFIAEHRGGSLTKEQHKHLILWACKCVEHILLYYTKTIDNRLANALEIARNWTKDNASVGQARQASLNAIEVAQESKDQIEIAIARSIGHAVATAHMADHSLIAVKYALKAVKLADKSIDMERKYQDENLSRDIVDLVLKARDKQKIKIKNKKNGINC
jgi:dihydrodipicolinate synthase/N-acetylneuraminate lyase